MSKVQFLPPVPVTDLRAQKSKSENPLRDALRDLRDGGEAPQDATMTGTTMLVDARSLNMPGVFTVSRVQAEILKVHNEGKAFYAYASSIDGVPGTIRVALVTREQFESTPAFRKMERLTHGHAVAQ